MKKVTCDCCQAPIIEPPVEEFEHEIELQTVKGGTLWAQANFVIIQNRPVMEGDQPWDAASFDICVACQLAALHRATKTIMKFSPCEWPSALVCLGPYRHEAVKTVVLGSQDPWPGEETQFPVSHQCPSTYAGSRCQGLAGHEGNHGCAGAHWNDFDAKTRPHGPHGGLE